MTSGTGTQSLMGADGDRLAFDRSNDGAGSAVLLLHGGGQTRHAWRRVHADLATAGHDVVSLDQRGHGESDWSPDGRYSFGDYGADVAALVGMIGRPPVLVGASLGGIAALSAVGLLGVPASGLVLVDITTRPRLEGTSRIHAFMSAHPDGFADIDEAAAAITALLPGRQQGSTDGLKRNLRRRDDGRWYWHWDPRILDHGPDAYGPREAEELEQAARHLDVATLLIWGGRSDVVTEDEAAVFQRLVPHAEVHRLASAHHVVTGDGNDAFGALVVDFVARLAVSP